MFVMDCGERAGTPTLNPPRTGEYTNAWTPDYYQNLLAAGGREVSSAEAKAGDIAFFDWNPQDGVIDHVEIVYRVSDGIVYTVGGNTGNKGSPTRNLVNRRTIPGSAKKVQGNICHIVRPNYYPCIDGVFFIRSAVTAESNKTLDVYYGSDSARYARNVQIYSYGGGDNQKFRITHIGDGWHTIESVATGKVLDVEGGVTKNVEGGATNVIVWPKKDKDYDNQCWRFIPDGSGYRIQSKLGGFLDVSGAGTANETNVQIYEGNGTVAQLWTLS